MAYSIVTKDGITIDNIPDEIPPDSQELKDRVAAIRQEMGMAAPEPVKPQEPMTFAKAAMPEIARPEFRQELGRQLGLTARAVPASAANLAGIVGDPLNALVNLFTDAKLPTISGATEPLLTRSGLPEPRPGIERGVYNVNTATLAAAMPGGIAARLASPVTTPKLIQTAAPTVAAQTPQALSRMFLEGPALQTSGAAGASAASQIAAAGGAGPAGQTAAALLGGVVAPGSASVVAPRSVSGTREIVRPFTQEGREVIAGNVLSKLAADPKAAIASSQQYSPRIPGYQPTTAQATRDLGLISAEPVIRSMDVAGRFTGQQSAANTARMTILDRMAKDKTAIEQAIAKRDEVTDPLRESAFARSTVDPRTFQSAVVLTVNNKIDSILNSPVGRRATVADVMKDAKADIARARTPAELYEIRKDLRAAERGLLDKSSRGGPTAGAFGAARPQLNEVIRAVDEAIEAAAPGYRDYLSKYAKASKGIESLEAAQAFRSKVLGTIPDPVTGEYLISQPSFTRAIRELEKGGFEGLSQTQIASLKKISKDLDDGVLSRAAKTPGSDTFKNLSTANLIGGIVGKQVFGEVNPALQSRINPFNWMYNGSDDMIKEILVEAMLDPKLASQLMAKASVVRLEPISKELQRKAISLGYGSVFGLEQ
jgi:hypothetical protein